jgi:hypothetical protein
MLFFVMTRRPESKRQWLFGLAMAVTALICLFGFAQLNPNITIIIALVALAALVALFWYAGRPANR